MAAALRRPPAVVTDSVGVLGGTFDPIHIGHLAIAEEVRESLALEQIRFVPTGTPVHRPEPPLDVHHVGADLHEDFQEGDGGTFRFQ